MGRKSDEALLRDGIDGLFAKGTRGDWIGVFENHDMSHPELGRRFALLFDKNQFDSAVIGSTRAPDTKMGLGWRYLLVAKCLNTDDVMGAMSNNRMEVR